MPRPAAQPKSVRLLMLAAVCVVVAALYLAREVLMPLALAILFTFLLAPISNRFERRLHRIPAVLLTVLITLGVAGLISYVVFDQLSQLAQDLPQYRDNIVEKIRVFRGGLDGEFTRAARTAEEIVTQATSQPASQPTGGAAVPVHIVNASPADPSRTDTESGFLGAGLGVLLDGLLTAGVVLILVLFMLFQRDDLRNRLIRLLGHGRLTLTTQALDDAATRVSRYLLAQCIVNGTYGLTIALGLWFIGFTMTDEGFPNFALWGLLCAVLRFIPYLGPWIAAAFPVAIAIIVFPGPDVLIAVGALFIVVEVLSNNLMEPWLYGSSTGVSPVAIIFAAVFWTWLWGPVGLILSTPLTVCLVVLGRYVPQMAFLDVLLGDTPVFEPHQAIYQRLIALDEEDAHDMADQFLATHSLPELHDRMLIPALGLAEQDRHQGLLDPRRREFIRTSLRQIIDDLDITDATPDGTPGPSPDASDQSQSMVPTTAPFTRLPAGSVINLLFLPAYDPADELAARMLAQVLQRMGYQTDTLSVTSLAAEMIQQVQSRHPDIVIISAMPPAATLHARYLCKRLHAARDDLRMLVTLWNSTEKPEKSQKKLACAPTVQIATSLPMAVQKIQQLIQPLLIKKK